MTFGQFRSLGIRQVDANGKTVPVSETWRKYKGTLTRVPAASLHKHFRPVPGRQAMVLNHAGRRMARNNKG